MFLNERGFLALVMSYWNWYFSVVRYLDNRIRLFSSNPVVKKTRFSRRWCPDPHVASEFSARKEHFHFQSWNSFSSLSSLSLSVCGYLCPLILLSSWAMRLHSVMWGSLLHWRTVVSLVKLYLWELCVFQGFCHKKSSVTECPHTACCPLRPTYYSWLKTK